MLQRMRELLCPYYNRSHVPLPYCAVPLLCRYMYMYMYMYCARPYCSVTCSLSERNRRKADRLGPEPTDCQN